MFKKLFKSKDIELFSPIEGRVIRLEEVADDVFSAKLVGDGFAIDPSDGKVYAPIDGKILQIFPTKHAIGIVSDEGIEILIHFGIDTVELKGEGFTSHVTAGDVVKRGDLLLEVDLESVTSKGKSIVTPIIFTNKAQYKSLEITYSKAIKNDIVCKIRL